MRKIPYSLATAMGLILACASASAADLKAFAKVTGPTIHLGDLMDGAGAAAGVLVRAAPAPGTEIVLPATLVSRLAKDNGVAITGGSAVSRIRVARAGIPVDADWVADAVRRELLNQGMTGDYEVEMRSAAQGLFIPEGYALNEVRLEHLAHNARSGRFSGTIVSPVGADRVERTAISGQAVLMTEIPVLAAAMDAGEIISDHDLDWLRVPANRVNRNAMTDATDLIGMSVKRRILPGRPVRLGDVERPRMVQRGQLIAMVVQKGAMTLTATGRAMEDGGRDDFIRVQNTATHRLVEGRVIGPNQVLVSLFGPIQTAAR